MMISEMMEVLEGMLEDGDRELRIATQQNWPFENSIRGIVEGRDLVDEDHVERPQLEDLSLEDLKEIAELANVDLPSEGHPVHIQRKILRAELHDKNHHVQNWIDENFGEEEQENNSYKDYVYIVEGRQIGYFTKDAWDNC